MHPPRCAYRGNASALRASMGVHNKWNYGIFLDKLFCLTEFCFTRPYATLVLITKVIKLRYSFFSHYKTSGDVFVQISWCVYGQILYSPVVTWLFQKTDVSAGSSANSLQRSLISKLGTVNTVRFEFVEHTLVGKLLHRVAKFLRIVWTKKNQNVVVNIL